jgi:hypothetical protein
MLTAEQIAQAQSEVIADTPTAIATHLGTYGVEAPLAEKIGKTAGAIIAVLYAMELGEAEASEESETPEMAEGDTPEEAKAMRLVKAFLTAQKAGATWSAANKAAIAEISADHAAVGKKIKSLHDAAHSTKEESAPEPQTKSVEPEEIDYTEWLKTQK